MVEAPKLLSIPKAADVLGVHSGTVREWVLRAVDPLPSVVLGKGDGKFVRRAVVMSEVDGWLARQAKKEGCIQ